MVKRLLTLLLILCIASCSYVKDKPLENSESGASDALSATCKLNSDEFSKVFEKDIEAQIRCLEENLFSFRKYVKPGETGYISEKDLTTFINNFFKNNSDNIVKSLVFIFEINKLFLRDENGKISNQNIKNLINLLVLSNKEIIKITSVLTKLKEQDKPKGILDILKSPFISAPDQELLRSTFKEAITSFSDKTLQIINNGGVNNPSLNIKEFLDRINSRMSEGKIDESLVTYITIIKKLLIGGEKQNITSNELASLMKKLPELAMVMFDLSYTKSDKFKTVEERHDFYIGQLSIINKLIDNKDDDIIITNDEIVTFVKTYFDKQIDSKLVNNLLKYIKVPVLGGKAGAFDVKDIKYLADLAKISIVGIDTFDELKLTSKDIDKTNFKDKRVKFLSHAKYFQEKTLELISKNQIPNKTLQIDNIVDSIYKAFPEMKINQDTVKSMINLKTLLVGGIENYLTPLELREMVQNLSLFSEIVFDSMYVKKDFFNSEEYHLHLENITKNIVLTLHPDDPESRLKTEKYPMTAFINVVDFLTDKKYDLIPKTEELKQLKSDILGGSPDYLVRLDGIKTLKIAQAAVTGFDLWDLISETQKNLKPENQLEYQNRISLKSTQFRQKLLLLYANADLPDSIKYERAIINATKLFELKNIPEKAIVAAIDLKTIFTGGARSALTSQEILKLIDKSPRLIEVLFEALKLSLFDLEKHQLLDQIAVILDKVKNLQETNLASSTAITNFLNLTSLLDEATDHKYKLDQKSAVITTVKGQILSRSQDFTVDDFNNLLQIAKIGTQAGHFYFDFSEENKDINQSNYKQKANNLSKISSTHIEILANMFRERIILSNPINYLSLINNVEIIADTKFNFKETIEKYKMFKPLIFGGSKDIISRIELLNTFNYIPNIIAPAINLITADKSFFNNGEYNQFLAKNITLINDELPIWGRDLVLASFDDIFKFITDLPNIPNEIKSKKVETQNILKTLLSGQNINQVTLKQARQVIDLGSFALNAYGHFEEVAQLFNNADEAHYYDDKKLIQTKAEHFIEYANNYLINDHYFTSSIDLYNLIDQLYVLIGDKLDPKLTPNKLKAFVGTKKILAGGQANILTLFEFQAIINKLSELEKNLYIITKLKDSTFTNTSEYDKEMALFSNAMGLIVYNNPSVDVIFNSTQYLEIADLVIKDQAKIERYRPSIEAIKEKVFGAPKNAITAGDINQAIKLLNRLMKSTFFSGVAYDLLKDGKEITKADLAGLFSDSEFTWNKEQFARFIKNYKLYRNKNGEIYYQNKVVYSKAGVRELAMLYWAIELLGKSYGHEAHTVPYYNFAVNNKELDQAFLDLRPVLEDLKLWSQDFSNFSNNVVLLSDLFQQQSNGTGSIDIDEGTEYAQMVFVAMDVSKGMIDAFKKVCPEKTDTTGSTVFDVPCYRKNYYQVLFEDLNYKKYLPKLYAYINGATPAERMKILTNIELFARDIFDDKIPVGSRDLVLITGSILNIETCLIRFDTNNNNQFDPSELDEAFKVYRSSIIKIAKLEGSEKYAKAVFLYMLKEQKIPSKPQVLWYYFFGNKKFIANRSSIASLLGSIVLQNKKNSKAAATKNN